MKSNHFLTLNHQFEIDKSQNIGKGSTGQVYLGNSLTSNQPVAIKIIKLQTIDNEVAHYLLQMEKTALTTLIHHNVLKAFKILQTTTKCYIITEYLNGGTLKDLINKQGSLSESKSLEIIRGILKGYSCLVKNNILHRDLKPANIMFHNQIPKIIDFGYCQIHGYPKPSLQYNVGSPSYMAPESFENSIYNEKTQIWGIGIILYECVMGKTLDDGKQMSQVFKRIKKQGIPFRKQISENCKYIISWCLDFNPQNRPSASQLLHYLSSNNNKNGEQYLIYQNERSKTNSLFEISNLYHSGHLNRKILESGRNVPKINFDIQHKTNLKKSTNKQFGIITKKISTMKQIQDFQNQNQIQTQTYNYNTAQNQYGTINYHPFKTQKHFPGQIVKNKHTRQLSSFGSLSHNSKDIFEPVHQQFKYGIKVQRNPESQKKRTFIKPSMSPCMGNRRNSKLATNYCATIVHQDVNYKIKDKCNHNNIDKTPLQRLIDQLQLQRRRNILREEKGLWSGYGSIPVYLQRQHPSSSIGQLNQYLKNAKKPISIFQQIGHQTFR